MGPLRRGLITAALTFTPATAWAEVCDKERPLWSGEPVTAFGELFYLLQTPIVLVLILATALALRLRSEWGGLTVVVGWSLSTFLATGWGDFGDIRAAAQVEGCIGPSTLYIGFAGLVCIGVVLYTAPLKRDKT